MPGRCRTRVRKVGKSFRIGGVKKRFRSKTSAERKAKQIRGAIYFTKKRARAAKRKAA
jgi:hypothetical protein